MDRMTTNEPNIVYPDLSYKIMGAIFEVHMKLGPGFLESIYEKALIDEISSRGMKVETQKVIDLSYKNKKIGVHRLDTFDGAKPRFSNRGEKRRSVSTLSIPRASDRGVEWVDFEL